MAAPMRTDIKKSKLPERPVIEETRELIVGDGSLEERIRRRAHQLYLQRGSSPGSELDDWLQAEKEVLLAENPLDS